VAVLRGSGESLPAAKSDKPLFKEFLESLDRAHEEFQDIVVKVKAEEESAECWSKGHLALAFRKCDNGMVKVDFYNKHSSEASSHARFSSLEELERFVAPHLR
jgi:hypothetical protein